MDDLEPLFNFMPPSNDLFAPGLSKTRKVDSPDDVFAAAAF